MAVIHPQISPTLSLQHGGYLLELKLLDMLRLGLVDELREAMLAVSDEKGAINRRILGKWISRHQDRIVNGLRFERSRGSTNAERWFVKSVSSVTSVSSGADSKLSQEENYDFLQ